MNAEYRFVWILTGVCSLAAAIITAPIIALDGGPWWTAFPIATFLCFGLGCTGSALVWIFERPGRK